MIASVVETSLDHENLKQCIQYVDSKEELLGHRR